MEVLKTQFPDVKGFQDVGRVPIKSDVKGKFVYGLKFEKCTGNFKAVQIHLDSNHFIVSAKLPNDDNVYVLESANSKKLTNGLVLQLSCLYGKPHENLNIQQHHTQQQRAKLGNCGLFAIANMLDFCPFRLAH